MQRRDSTRLAFARKFAFARRTQMLFRKVLSTSISTMAAFSPVNDWLSSFTTRTGRDSSLKKDTVKNHNKQFN